MRHYVRNRYGRLSIKLRRAIFKMGAAGMGIYTYLREEMEENGGWLYVDDIKMFARELKTSAKKVTQLVTDFELFSVNEEEGVFECVELPNVEIEEGEESEKETVTRKEVDPELSEKRRKAIQKRWVKNTNLYKANTNGDTKPDTNLYSENTNGDTKPDTNLYHSKSEQENAENCAFSEVPRARTIVNNNINNNINNYTSRTEQQSCAKAAFAAAADAEVVEVEEGKTEDLPIKGKKRRVKTESRAAEISTPPAADENGNDDGNSLKRDFKGLNSGLSPELDKSPTPAQENANKRQITPFNQNGLLAPARDPEEIRNDILMGMGHDYLVRNWLSKAPSLTQVEMINLIPDFITQLQVDGKTNETGRGLWTHFGNWLGKKAQYIQNNRNNADTREQADARRRRSQQISEDIMLGKVSLFSTMPGVGGGDADDPPF